MNTLSPEPAGELLTPWLLAYDFAVADEAGKSSEPIPPDLTVHVEQVKSCLRLLDSVWPRSPTREDLGALATTPGDEGRPGRSTRLPDVPGFDMIKEIARGGMGVVYQARQQSLDRIVAIKCLPPIFAEDPERLARFQREARAAAKLAKHGILPIYDVLDTGDMPVLVMPYIEGSNLARILADRVAVRAGKPTADRHAWATLDAPAYLACILPVLDTVVGAVATLHQAKIIHRDIKPSNILVDEDGRALLSDFGLARLGDQETVTRTGQSLGTPGYMSTEQWDGGERIDERTDIFSLGATLYQALTLTLPYGRRRVTADTPLPFAPRRHEPQLPPGVDSVILRAVAPDVRDRYQSVAEFQEDWGRVRQGAPLRTRPPRLWPRQFRRRWRTFAGALCALLALSFALQLLSVDTPDTRPIERTVMVETEPPGAEVVFVPLDPDYGEPMPDKAVRPKHGETTPLKLQLLPGLYFVEAQVPGRGFHQVYRYVPKRGEEMAQHHDHYLDQQRWSYLEDGAIGLSPIHIPDSTATKGMTRLAGGEFQMGSTERGLGSSRPTHTLTLQPYYLDVLEVTEKDYSDLQRKLKLEHTLPPELAYQPRGGAFPVTKVWYGDAVAWAERAGKRLPTEAEYEYAATNGGKTRFPWGDDEQRIKNGWPLGKAGQPAWDHTQTTPPIHGLYSNVAEWTCTSRIEYPGAPFLPTPGIERGTTRVVRGGPYSLFLATPEIDRCLLGPRQRNHLTIDRAWPGVGFRCARSVAPLFLSEMK